MVALVKPDNIIAEPSGRILHGDCLSVLRGLPDNSVDAMITDPPCGIGFMSAKWDTFDDKTHKSRQTEKDTRTEEGKWLEGRGTLPYGFSPSLGHSKRERENFTSFMTEVMQEALRCLRPGGHAFVWALPRTSHWTATALEDAGFEIRDVITHLFGSGFPKSHNISVAIDKHLNAEREVIGEYDTRALYDGLHRESEKSNGGGTGYGSMMHHKSVNITSPATPEAQQYSGYGTALKPSNEHWILCRKPLSESTIAKNVLTWGTGGLAIDASRITAPDHPGVHKSFSSGVHEGWDRPWRDGREPEYKPTPQGRFPSNTLMSHTLMCVERGVKRVRVNDKAHDRHNGARIDRAIYGDYDANITTGYADEDGMEQVTAWECDPSCPVYQLDCQSGITSSHGGGSRYKGPWSHPFKKVVPMPKGDTGGASRFFAQFHPTEEDIAPFLYCSKASRTERNQGCEGLSERQGPVMNDRCVNCGKGRMDGRRLGSCCDNPEYERVAPHGNVQNSHPTVKPLQLMRYLITMITPPDGIVLDPFAGSGSTLVACVQTGHGFIGIEQDESYVTIARSRIAHAERGVY